MRRRVIVEPRNLVSGRGHGGAVGLERAVKLPLSRVFPSAWVATLKTTSLALGSKALSRLPSLLSRAMLFRAGAGSAIGLERREASAEQNFPVRLHSQAENDIACIGIEAAVEAAIIVQPRNVVAGRGARGALRLEFGEGAAEQNLPVRLHDHVISRVVGVGVKGVIEAAIAVDPRNEVAGRGASGRHWAGASRTDRREGPCRPPAPPR